MSADFLNITVSFLSSDHKDHSQNKNANCGFARFFDFGTWGNCSGILCFLVLAGTLDTDGRDFVVGCGEWSVEEKATFETWDKVLSREELTLDDFELVNYEHDKFIKFPIAV